MIRIFCENYGFSIVDTNSLLMIAGDRDIKSEKELLDLAKQLFPKYDYPSGEKIVSNKKQS